MIIYLRLFVCLALLMATPALAQDWSFGPKAYLGLSRRLSTGDVVQVPGGSIATAGDGDAIGSSIGGFARYDRPRWYAEANLMTGGSYAANLSVSTNLTGGGPLYNSSKRQDLRLLVGYKPLPWLRLSAGLVGVHNNWGGSKYATLINQLEAQAQAEQRPEFRERLRAEATSYRLADDIRYGLKRRLLEAQLGIGADIGGLTLDVVYNPSLSPVLDGVTTQGQTYCLQQRYATWSLGVGYKLFPLKKHLLAPRKNRAYARLQRDIPFLKQEFHVGIGMEFEDFNSAIIYENRYTRYIRPRLGWSVGLAYQRGVFGYQAYDANATTQAYNAGRFSAQNQVSLLAGLRLLPLYSRHHRLGITPGAFLAYGSSTGAGGSYRRVTVNGKDALLSSLTFYTNPPNQGLRAGWLVTIDYQFLPTDRLALGPWLRVNSDAGSFGLQLGYRF